MCDINEEDLRFFIKGSKEVAQKFQRALLEKDLPEIETLIPASHKTGDVKEHSDFEFEK